MCYDRGKLDNASLSSVPGALHQRAVALRRRGGLPGRRGRGRLPVSGAKRVELLHIILRTNVTAALHWFLIT